MMFCLRCPRHRSDGKRPDRLCLIHG